MVVFVFNHYSKTDVREIQLQLIGRKNGFTNVFGAIGIFFTNLTRKKFAIALKKFMIEFFDQEFIIFYDLQLGRFYKKILIDWVLNIEIFL